MVELGLVHLNGLNLCLWFRGIIPRLVERLDGFDASTKDMHTNEDNEDKEQDLALQRPKAIVAGNVSVGTTALRTSNSIEMERSQRNDTKEKESTMKGAKTIVATSAGMATEKAASAVQKMLSYEALLVREGTMGSLRLNADAVDDPPQRDVGTQHTYDEDAGYHATSCSP